ncbi:MAG: MBL fold metallo-hydrolase, partial [Bacteroidota bacterium]
MKLKVILLILFITVLLTLIGGGIFVYSITQPAGEVPVLQPRPQPVKADFTIEGDTVTVHALPTGTIQIKSCHHDGCLPENTPYTRRFGAILQDDQFVQPMPIWTYVVQHPKGTFIIDTGGASDWNDPESWSCDPVSGRICRSMARVQILEEEKLEHRLAKAGIQQTDIQAAIITHLHFDHTAGIRMLDIPTYVGQGDLDNAQNIGSVPCRFLDGAELRGVEPLLSPKTKESLLGPALSLTSDKTFRIYHTPGHTPGSLTVELKTDQGEIWFVGDTMFKENDVEEGKSTAGIHTDISAVRTLHGLFRQKKSKGYVLLLPSHDAGVEKNLTNFG